MNIKIPLQYIIMELKPYQIKQYYLQEGVLDQLFSLCRNKEIVPVFAGGQFGKRPCTIPFRGDLEQLIKQGATSFHGSVELWRNPLLLSSNMKQDELNKLRTSWDLVFDIDCNESLDFARDTVLILAGALKKHGVKNISVKFSGSRGFHIGISHKSFPEEIDYKKTSVLFPTLAQNIVIYLKDFMRDELAEKLNLDDPYKAVEVEQNWGSRHLFRLPYSFNEKTWLVSMPLEIKNVRSFRRENAKPENVKSTLGFMDTWGKNEMQDLIMEAMDWQTRQELAEPEQKTKKTYTGPTGKIPEEFFPPCIKLILQGLKDGRKRSIFILINFLRSAGWNWKETEEVLREWNKKNKEAIREVYITTQVNYAKHRGNEVFPPPNCDNKDYYEDIGICKPDNLCSKIKNPISYTLRKTGGKKKRKKSR